MSRPRIVVVAKRTAYQRFIEEESDPRARGLIERQDPSVAHWVASHQEHMRTLEELELALQQARVHALYLHRAHAVFDTSDASLVIAVGGDGTLLAASHNVGKVPIVGINSAPSHSVGFFCAIRRAGLRKMIPAALAGELPAVELTRMSVLVNGRLRSRRVLNEALYCHASPAGTSRYVLELAGKKEEHRSSGFWVGPAAGSTAAQRSAGGRILPLSSSKLQLVVREPYAPFGQKYKLLHSLVDTSSELTVLSKMDDACIFLDGPHKQLPVRLGDRVIFRASDEPLTVLGLRGRGH